MSRKGKGVVVAVAPEEAKARLKHQSLMQDFLDLQKEADAMRSRLEATKHQKLTLTAEVRFLRRRYKSLKETKSMDVAEEHTQMQPLKSAYQANTMKEQPMSRKVASQHGLPPIPERKTKKKRYGGKEIAPSTASPVMHSHLKEALHGGNKTPSYTLTPISVLEHQVRMNMRKPNFDLNPNVLGLDFNGKERMHIQNDATFSRPIPGFDLNQDSVLVRKDAPLPNRALVFDLNEVSTGDDDFQSNVEVANLEEAKKNMIRGLNDEQPDLKLSICRDSGEGSSRAGKRKISWQDPVALRV